MKSLFIVLFLFVSFQLFSQPFSQEFGKVILQELTLKKYPKDTNAEAVMIYDIGESSFNRGDDGFFLVFERSSKIRVFKKPGTKWAEVEIPYYYEGDIFEAVYDVEAASYNIEGGQIKKTPLDVKTIYDEKVNEYWRRKKFAVPNVKEGSVIEYRYHIRSPYLFNMRDWEFQRSIPTVYSLYTTRMIPFYEYIYLLQGRTKFDVFERIEDTGMQQQFGSINYRDLIYKFGMTDVPAFTDESFITSKKDFLWKIDFQLTKIHKPDGVTIPVMSTWPALCSDLLKESTFGKYMNSAEKGAADMLNLPDLALKGKSEQLEHIVNFVKANYSWNGNLGKYASKSLKEFQKEKTGNGANINLYLAGLLKGAGFEAFPVLISTRGNGSVYKDYPFLHFFNNVIVLVKVGEKFVFTDATDSYCPFDRIPPHCLNGLGLIVKKEGEGWAALVNPEISKIEESLFVDFNPGLDSVNLSVQRRFSNYEAYDYKVAYKNDIAEITKSLNKKDYYIADSVVTQNYDNPKEKYFVKYKAKVPFDMVGEKIYISPFLNEAVDENPLKQTERTYPVDFIYPFGRTYIS
ncbi:MAG TPA: DUF3857 domain-containing protein, partial [Bacteroidales bacterium]|nr:DUF3857 domain-containing protein [Bacteroidales bacterium]